MTTKDAQASEADVWLNKLAMRQQPIGSWFPQHGQVTDSAPDDDEDLNALDEYAGLGAPKIDEADSQIDQMLRRNKMSNDKLLETLIGKKAANARRKAQAKGNIASNHAAPKPVKSANLESAQRGQSDDDEEEESRAAAFTSKRKTRDQNLPAYTTGGSDSPARIDEPIDPRDDLATMGNGGHARKDKDSGAEQKVSKRKPTSYLDELLSSKKRKKTRA